MLYWSIMQKSTCPYLKTKISCIQPTYGFGLQHLLKDFIISPFLTLLGHCTVIPWVWQGQRLTKKKKKKVTANFNCIACKGKVKIELLSESKRKSEVQQDLLWVFSVLGPPECIFSLRLASSIQFTWTQKLHAPPLNFLISHWNPLTYFSPCTQDIQILLSQIFWGRGKWITLPFYSSPSQNLCFYESWFISNPLVLPGATPRGAISLFFYTQKKELSRSRQLFSWIWLKNNKTKYLSVPGSSPACIQIDSIKVLEQTAVKHLYTICKY